MKNKHPNYVKFLQKEKFSKIVAIDFDDVIYQNITNCLGWDCLPDLPVKDAETTLNELKLQDWYIIIYSARIINKKTLKAIKKWLIKNNIVFDEIWNYPGKPFANVYVDDRALKFEGDWKKTFEEIKDFKTWREK